MIFNGYALCLLIALVTGPAVAAVAAWRSKVPAWPFAICGVLVVLVGWPASHVAYLLGNVPGELAANPVLLLKLWNGMASWGFVLALPIVVAPAVIAGRAHLWPVLDAATWGLAWAWAWGRLGCFLAHDHPGPPTSFPLAVRGICVDGGRTDPSLACHDLGLYELLFTLAFLGVALGVSLRGRPGWLAPLAALSYGVTRFGLDFLRSELLDPRWCGLTPMQWLCFVLVAAGIGGLWRRATERS